jgi:polyhydroxyalkanoate synthase
METFVRGLGRYHTHAFRRGLSTPPAVWQRGAASLRDYGGPGDAPAVLFVPSLINRGYILDLAADRSLVRASAAQLRTFLLDWGEPGREEKAFTLADYIGRVLIPALEEVRALTRTPPRLAGYCMGGTLAAAPAVVRPDLVSALALLAAPWDFHAEAAGFRALLGLARSVLETIIAANGCAPVDLLQALFASLDPALVGRKFRAFAALDPSSEAAQRFVELEDWLNDGIPLAGPVARECLFGWYVENQTAARKWRLGETLIDPARIACPAMAFIPAQDRIVPPNSAWALAKEIPGARIQSVDLGHIGMIAGSGAAKRVYGPLIAWLRTPT